MSLLVVEDLKVHFPKPRGLPWRPPPEPVKAVDGVSFTVEAGETFGLVGESGCGKSTTARAIIRLVQQKSGQVSFEGKRVDQLTEAEMHPVRRGMQMIFQDPFASLNPRMTVGSIVEEPMRIFSLHDPRRRKLEVMRLLDMVGLNPRFLNRYPHEFSGGQRQRIGIARALAVQPKLILCDEPVSALDVSIQAQVINLLKVLQQRLGLAYVFIAHDLSVVRHICDRVGVMYLGRLVETAETETLFRNPLHPYTKALLSAVPTPDPKAERLRRRTVLVGEVPSPDQVYPGCPFAGRCPIAEPLCTLSPPILEGDEHKVSCFLAHRQVVLQ